MKLRTTLVLLIAALALAAMPAGSVSAQAASADEPAWSNRFGEQMHVLLTAPDAARQEHAMKLILRYARRADMTIDYRPITSDLFQIYERADDEGQRLLALAALESIGTPAIMEQLAERILQQNSDRVRHHTLRILAVHRDRG